MKETKTPTLNQPGNLVYTARQVEQILGIGRMTLSRYAQLGLLTKAGYNEYTKHSVDLILSMSQAQRNEAIRDARKVRPELTSTCNLPEAIVVLNFDPGKDGPNPVQTLIRYAYQRKRSRAYPVMYLCVSEESYLFRKLYEAIRIIAPPGMEFHSLPSYQMQESCISFRTRKDFDRWQAARQGQYIPEDTQLPNDAYLTPAPYMPLDSQPLPPAKPAMNEITVMTDGRQAILQDDRLFNLHSEADLEKDSDQHRRGINRLHYAPHPQVSSLNRPRLHDPGNAIIHLKDSHSLTANRGFLEADPGLRLLLEDQLEEEEEVIDYFIEAMNSYLYRLIQLTRKEGTFPQDEEGNLILPDRLSEYQSHLPKQLQEMYATAAKTYPAGYLTSFSLLTQVIRDSVKDGPGVPRTHQEKVRILEMAEELNKFLR